jgi:hypothetical protein
MKLLIEFIEAFVDFIVANGTASKSEAVDFLQTQTNGVNNAEGNAFMDAMAAYTESLGWNAQPTYNNMRNMIVNDGDVKSKAFFNAVLQNMIESAGFQDPVVQEVLRALRIFDLQRQRTRLVEQIQFIVSARDALPAGTAATTNREENAMRRAYRIGLQDMRAERDGIDNRISANNG